MLAVNSGKRALVSLLSQSFKSKRRSSQINNKLQCSVTETMVRIYTTFLEPREEDPYLELGTYGGVPKGVMPKLRPEE